VSRPSQLPLFYTCMYQNFFSMLISNKNVKYSLKYVNMYYWVRVKVMMLENKIHQKIRSIIHWPRWYGSGIYNYLCMCNQCLSPLKLWARIQHIARCTRYNIMYFSTNKTDRPNGKFEFNFLSNQLNMLYINWRKAH
jgi:hypothetical protein